MMSLLDLEIIGLVAMITGLWSQLLGLLTWPRRLLVVRRELSQLASQMLMSYLAEHARRRQLDGGFFQVDRTHVRPLDRVATVCSEDLVKAGQLFWLPGRPGRPIWHTYHQQNNGPDRNVYFIRWTVNFDQLMLDAAAWEDQQLQERGGRRYRVRQHGAMPVNNPNNQPPSSTALEVNELTNPGSGVRLIGWRREDLGTGRPMSLETMSLRPEQAELASDVDHFMRSRLWAEERGIPWRRGWMAYGRPGTGKTSFIRAIGVEHDLPIHVFDLGGMYNDDLRHAWQRMLEDTPCIALIEDIDGVYGKEVDGAFDARALVKDGPTFDSLLQCIGGVSTCDGVLLFVTTNRPERVDQALRRGGRIDMEVEFLPMDDAGRLKMARRILGDDARAFIAISDRRLTHHDGVELSPADFQERLYRMALAERFGGSP